MRFRLTNCLRVCAWMLGVLQVVAVHGQLAGSSPRAGQSIEFSDPRPQSGTVTNVSRLGRELSGADDDARPDLHPSRVISDSSMQAVLALPTMPFAVSTPVIVRDKHSRDWLDPNTDWSSLTPDEMLRQFALQNILKGANPESGNDRGQSRGMSGGVYDGLLENRTGRPSSKPASSYDAFSSRSQTERLNKSASGFNPAPSSAEILGVDHDVSAAGASGRPESLAELLGLSASSSGSMVPGLDHKQDTQAREAQVDAYQNLLNGIYETRPAITAQEPRPSSPWQGGGQASASTANAMNPFATLPGGTVNPALLPPPLPRAPVPASLTPAPYTPEPQPASSMLLRNSGFEATRRPF